MDAFPEGDDFEDFGSAASLEVAAAERTALIAASTVVSEGE